MTHPVDVHVGATLRLLRYRKKLSLGKLGELMGGLHHHQIYKYELAENRMSASALWNASEIFEVHPGYFFDALMPVNDTPEARRRQADLLDALSCIPSLSRINEFTPEQHKAIDTMISAMLPRR